MSDSNNHFTYDADLGEHLQQGDLLRRTTEISKLLEEVHPHYERNSDSYLYFIVLTQSCDLVRRERGSPCKSRYITLAGVRPFFLALDRELESMQSPLERIAEACKSGSKERLRMFLERLLNNNEPTLFYLHENAALGIQEPCCAFLRLSIAIRAHDHYEKCLEARVTSLSKPFQAKLGWLVGNIYSRVGTEDWVPACESQDQFKLRISNLLDKACIWIDDKKLIAANRSIRATSSQMPTDKVTARALIDGQEIKSRREKIQYALEIALSDTDLLGEKALTAKEIRKVIEKLNTIAEYKQARD